MWRFAIVLVFGLGCAQERDIEFVDLSTAIPSEALSIVLAIVDLETNTIERALAIEAPIESALFVEAEDRSLELTVIAYDKTLSEVGLPAGPLAFVDSGPSRALPPGVSIQSTVLSDSSEWRTIAELPAVLASKRVPLECRSFRSTLHTLDTPAPVHAMVSEDDGAVLAFAGGWGERSTVYRVRQEGVERLDSDIPDWDQAVGTKEVFAAHFGSGGRLWLAVAGRPSLLVGTLTAGFVAVPRRTVHPERFIRWIAVVPGPGGNDTVYAETDHGDAYRYRERDQAWEPLSVEDDRPLVRCSGSPNGYCGGVHLMEDDNVVFAAASGSGAVLTWTGSAITTEMVPDPQLGDVTAVEASAFGLVAIRSDAGAASLFTRDGGAWPLSRRLNSQRITAALGYDNSLLVGGVFAFLTELGSDADCDSIGGATVISEPGTMVRSGVDVFVARGGNIFPPPDTALTRIAVLRPERP